MFDALNRPVETTAPGNTTTYMDYDRHGNLSAVTDAEGRQTTYQYDDMGRLISETSPDTGTIVYGYDAAGNKIRSMDSRGVVVTYTPDVLGRTRRIDYPAYAGQDAFAVTYTFDDGPGGRGRMTAMSDASGSTAWDYSRFDALGLVGKTTQIDGYSYTGYVVHYQNIPPGRFGRLIVPSDAEQIWMHARSVTHSPDDTLDWTGVMPVVIIQMDPTGFTSTIPYTTRGIVTHSSVGWSWTCPAVSSISWELTEEFNAKPAASIEPVPITTITFP